MPGARWFPGARLNFAENLLRRGDDAPGPHLPRRGRRPARARPAPSCAARWRALRRGPARRAASSPATASPASCPTCPRRSSPCWRRRASARSGRAARRTSARRACCDRFGQIAPKVLFVADGYVYGGKRSRLGATWRPGCARSCPACAQLVVVPYLSARRPTWPALPRRATWAEFLAPPTPRTTAPTFVRLPFDHPLYIMYSSGTTGLPKCMVHSAGGTLLQHLKEHRLHRDLRPGRPPLLLHHLRLDDVELAGVGPGLRRHAGALRRRAAAARSGALGPGRRGAGAPSSAPAPGTWPPARRPGLRAGAAATTCRPCAASCRPARRWRPSPSTRSTATSRPTCSSAPSPAAPTSSPASPWATRCCRCGAASCSAAGSAWRWRSWDDGRPARGGREGRAGLHARRSRACPSASGTTPTARATAPPTSSASRASGATATTPSCAPRAAWSSTAAATRCSTPAACASAPPRSTASSSSSPRCVESLVVGQEWQGDVRVVLFVQLREGLALDDDAARAHPPAHPRRGDAAPRAGQDRPGRRHPAHHQRQDHRAGRAQGRSTAQAVDNRDALANPEALDQFRDLPELQA